MRKCLNHSQKITSLQLYHNCRDTSYVINDEWKFLTKGAFGNGNDNDNDDKRMSI